MTKDTTFTFDYISLVKAIGDFQIENPDQDVSHILGFFQSPEAQQLSDKPGLTKLPTLLVAPIKIVQSFDATFHTADGSATIPIEADTLDLAQQLADEQCKFGEWATVSPL